MFSTTTVAAAIATLADSFVNERDVKSTDGDALALISNEAENLIAEQLMRFGMAAEEATELASDAAMRTGSATDESNRLVSAAITNRGQPVGIPAADNDEGDEGDAADTNAAAQPVSADNDVEEAPESAVAETTGKPASRRKAATASSFAPSVARVEDQMIQRAFTVEKRSVFQIFTSIPQTETIFNFDLPYIKWAEPHPDVPAVDPHYNMDATSLLTILYAIKNRKSIAIVGPHGAGKTKLVEQIGARLNMPVTIIPMDGQMSRGHLFGQEKIRSTPTGPESYYAYGILPRALKEPGIILFDEIDRADEGIQYACHSVYEQRFLKLMENKGEEIPVHPLNRVAATANTKGRGSMDGMYGVGNEMSEATRDRWSVWIEQDYQDQESDIVVLTAKVPDITHDMAKTIAHLAEDIRSSFKNGQLAQTCSMRQQLEAAEMAVDLSRGGNQSTPDERAALRNGAMKMAIQRVILGRASEEDKGAIATLLDTINPDINAAANLI